MVGRSPASSIKAPPPGSQGGGGSPAPRAITPTSPWVAAAGWDEIAGAGGHDSETLAPRMKGTADAVWEGGIKSKEWRSRGKGQPHLKLPIFLARLGLDRGE